MQKINYFMQLTNGDDHIPSDDYPTQSKVYGPFDSPPIFTGGDEGVELNFGPETAEGAIAYHSERANGSGGWSTNEDEYALYFYCKVWAEAIPD